MSNIRILKNLIQRDFNKLNPDSLYSFKKKWAKDYGKLPKNSVVFSEYKDLLNEGKIQKNEKLEQKLMVRRVRSMSGVTPFAVMTKPYPCPGSCTYCPQDKGLPKSYLSDEPAAQRALKFDFDPKKQVKNRLKQLYNTGHSPEKIEIIVIGGTFSSYPQDYKINFIKGIFDVINASDSKSIEEAQTINETAERKVVGISVETRPDWIDKDEVILMRRLGVTKVQMGAQAFDNKILRNIKRGHTIKDTARATCMLKDAGIKVCYHFMPNLPGSSPKKDIRMVRKMYKDPRFKPDFVKIYPVQVIPGTVLHKQWEEGEYSSYSSKELWEVLKKIKLLTPPWTRIDRLIRDISKKWISSGTEVTNMRQLIQNKLKKDNQYCRCIRCREIKGKRYNIKPNFVQKKIKTKGAREFFLTFEGEGGRDLYSLLRLRLPNSNKNIIFKELENSSLIREVHTFGQVVSIDERNKGKAQHQGLGQELLNKAEEISKSYGFKKIAVISAVGTRQYYKKFGYKKEGLYMTKYLT